MPRPWLKRRSVSRWVPALTSPCKARLSRWSKANLMGIARARKLSRAAMRNIRQNLFFAFIYNLLGVPIAAGVLYPWLGLMLNPMIASAAMSLSSLSVVGNALRLRKVEL